MEFLELEFSLQGRLLPADHGYSLYSAIKRIMQGVATEVPSREVKISPDVLLSTIAGIPDRKGMVYLNRSSRLRLRCPSDQIRDWYKLQNQVLNIRGHLIRLIQPRLALPQPSGFLKSRLVTFKLEAVDHADLPKYFLESCRKALDTLGVQGDPVIDSNEHGDLARRTLTIKQKRIVGYGVVIEQLNNEESVKLQCHGIGGRKHFGCGWFYPIREYGE